MESQVQSTQDRTTPAQTLKHRECKKYKNWLSKKKKTGKRESNLVLGGTGAVAILAEIASSMIAQIIWMNVIFFERYYLKIRKICQIIPQSLK